MDNMDSNNFLYLLEHANSDWLVSINFMEYALYILFKNVEKIITNNLRKISSICHLSL